MFYELVKRVWDGLDKTNLDPVRHTTAKSGYREPRGQTFLLAPGGNSWGTSMSASSGGSSLIRMLSLGWFFLIPTVRGTERRSEGAARLVFVG